MTHAQKPTQRAKRGMGSLILLAWPETLVAMIPRWYSLPLSAIGIVRNGKIRAGHAAAALIDHSSGEVLYTDFGRYITPLGMGRTRTKLTDPEVEMPISARFDTNGAVSNLDAILETLASRPLITHGDGPMYASLASGIDAEGASVFISKMNLAGSVHYDPFDREASNCARYVHDLARHALGPGERERRLVRNSLLTASPLGTVIFGADNTVWRVDQGRIAVFDGPARRSVIGTFFKKQNPVPAENPMASMNAHNFHPHADDHLLSGTGSSSYFRILERAANGRQLLIRRTESDGEIRFEKRFEAEAEAPGMDGLLNIVHDTNAHWATVVEGKERFRFWAV